MLKSLGRKKKKNSRKNTESFSFVRLELLKENKMILSCVNRPYINQERLHKKHNGPNLRKGLIYT